MKERIVLLGGTGSIGSSVLDVIRHYPDRFALSGVSGYRNRDKLAAIVREFNPSCVCLPAEDPSFFAEFPGLVYFFGEAGLSELAGLAECDTVIIAVSGISGLGPTLSAIRAHDGRKKLLSANKEAIVAAGDVVNALLDKHGASIVPLDSEHNAIFSILTRVKPADVNTITLTASGGPFLHKPIGPGISVEDVLKHPTWNMGSYITVNSATMMNKGFEVIESHHLFRMEYDRIRVLIHPQSIIHGIVELADGTCVMVASPSDMRYPVAISMFYPQIPQQRFPPLELSGRNLEFQEPDLAKFPLLGLAYETGRTGGMLPCAMNAANEEVVEAFLEGVIPFHIIPDLLRRTVDDIADSDPSRGVTDMLEAVRIVDREARTVVHGHIRSVVAD
jgi:1-deoxy-D-xylulose-5-phosphate reductoisomerase